MRYAATALVVFAGLIAGLTLAVSGGGPAQAGAPTESPSPTPTPFPTGSTTITVQFLRNGEPVPPTPVPPPICADLVGDLCRYDGKFYLGVESCPFLLTDSGISVGPLNIGDIDEGTRISITGQWVPVYTTHCYLPYNGYGFSVAEFQLLPPLTESPTPGPTATPSLIQSASPTVVALPNAGGLASEQSPEFPLALTVIFLGAVAVVGAYSAGRR
jgi:hypothetical protein